MRGRREWLAEVRRQIAVVLFVVAGLVVPSAHAQITISDKGVGPINPNTPFSLKEIAKLFPKLTVSAGTDTTEGQEFPTIEVRDSRGILFRIMPETDQARIHAVVTTRPDLYRGRGKIGSPYSRLFGTKVSDACHWGMEELSDDLICQLPGSKSVFLLFNGYFNPTDPTTPELDKMRVTEVFWSAMAAR